MLNRLGLVIHWLGFGFGLLISLWLGIDSIFDMPSATTVGTVVETLIGIPIVVFIFTLPTWGIRFILTNHKSPLPWVANKEAT